METTTIANTPHSSEKKHPYLFVSFLLSVFTTYAIIFYCNPYFAGKNTVPLSFITSFGDVSGHLLTSLLLGFFTLFYSRVLAHKKLLASAGIIASLFMVFTVTGLSFKTFNDLSLWTIYLIPRSIVALYGYLTPAALIGYFCLYYALVASLFFWLDARTEQVANNTDIQAPTKHISLFLRKIAVHIQRHPFAAATIIIALCWIPYIVILYPGDYVWDGFRQLSEYFGYIPKTTHHPYLATLAMGGLYSIGYHISGPTIGVFIYGIVQSILGCCAFAFTSATIFRFVKKSSFPHAALPLFFISTLFFTLYPMFPISMLQIVKDVPYMISTVVTFTIVAIAVIEKHLPTKLFILYVIAGAGVLTFRNDGIVILLASAICIIIALTKHRIRIATATASMTALLLVFNSFIAPALGVSKFSNVEVMSVPLQQTARYLRDHPEDVTVDEYAQLQSMLKKGKDLDKIGELYTPWISDPVKNSFKAFDSDTMKQYLQIWFAMFQRHPGTYIEATLAGTSDYFYPFYGRVQGAVRYNAQIHLDGDYWVEMREFFGVPAGDMDVHYPQSLKNARTILSKITQHVNTIPIVAFLSNTGFYVWILILCAGALIRKKKGNALLAFIPVLLIYLICLVSPVNGNIRYAMPYMAATPLLLGFTVSVLLSKKKASAAAPEVQPNVYDTSPLIKSASSTDTGSNINDTESGSNSALE